MKTVLAKVVFAGMLLLWALPFRADAAYPQTCTNPNAYYSCFDECFSNIGVCEEYCQKGGYQITWFEVDYYYWSTDGNPPFHQVGQDVDDFMSYTSPSCNQCVSNAYNCVSNCVSYCD